jgi:hypothetical protein
LGHKPGHELVVLRYVASNDRYLDDAHAIAAIGGQKISCVFRTRIALKPGDTARLSFSQGSNHFFDPVTTMGV